MRRHTCFTVYGGEDDVSEDGDWDEAVRLKSKLEDGDDADSDAGNARALCSECGRPLRRTAKVPDCACLLLCRRKKECTRCEDLVLPGELHFRCVHCDVVVCKACGPGVYIERSYDYFDTESGEGRVAAMPSNVLHERRARKRVQGRGMILAQQAPDPRSVAQRVVENVRLIVQDVLHEEEEFLDKEWHPPDLLQRILGTGSVEASVSNIQLLAAGVSKVLTGQTSSLSKVPAPCKIFGDLHGQFRDLMLFFSCFGMPGSPQCPRAVFNGDFVDRGKHQLEVVCVLFSLKIAHPDKVFLNRGNHEDHHMNVKYGFQKACDALHPVVYQDISRAFEMLPLAAVVDRKILCVHGGIGNGTWNLRDLDKVQRPLTHEDLQKPENKWLWNILWSDPIEDDEAGTNVFGVHPSPRSKTAVKFGWNVTQAFCAMNGLDLIVRSHQSKKAGLGFDVMHNETLIRVFSARDYEHNANDGAILSVARADDDDDESDENEDGAESPRRATLNVRPQVLGSLIKEH